VTNEEKALIAYRMERAKEGIIEAKTLLAAGLLNAYVNRLYYVCFYAISALLLTKNLSTSKHSYLRSLMNREFVNAGLIPKELGKHFDLLFNNRMKADYGDFVKFQADSVKGWLGPTEKFVAHVEGLIHKLS
jgi:uncharacterized protein (UPF0332 family)